MMDREERYGAYLGILIGTLIAFLVIALGGCASIEYTDGTEKLKVTTWFKSVDGFAAERGPDGFAVIIDKTRTNDPLPGLVDLLETINELKSMGLSYDPPRPNE
jgi:hypothetical protein